MDGDLAWLHRQELEILEEFQRVCRELNVSYYLTAGSLLGAVRHGGFIPWDDDVDVAMPRGDYDRLCRLWQGTAAEGFLLQEYRCEPRFPYYFAKIRRQGTRVEEPVLREIEMEQGCYIDIFPLDRCPDSQRLAKLFFQTVTLLNCAVLAQVSREFQCGYKKKGVILCWRLLSALPVPMLFGLREGVRRLFGGLSSGKRLCTVGGNHGYPRESYDTDWFRETVFLNFEGRSMPCPGGWDALLSSMYGDYQTPPEEWERRGHFINTEEEDG